MNLFFFLSGVAVIHIHKTVFLPMSTPALKIPQYEQTNYSGCEIWLLATTQSLWANTKLIAINFLCVIALCGSTLLHHWHFSLQCCWRRSSQRCVVKVGRFVLYLSVSLITFPAAILSVMKICNAVPISME